jgi:hypothetical protein
MPASNCSPKQACVNSWNNTEFFFVGMGLLGTLSGIVLNIVDCRSKYHVLNLSDAAVKALRKADEVAESEGSVLIPAEDIYAEDSVDSKMSVNSPLLTTAVGKE